MNVQDVQDANNAFSFKNYCYTSQQAVISTARKLQGFRNNPDLFHKVCQVSFATLQLIMARYPSTSNLSKLSFVLSTADMHYFYNVLKIPKQFFLPVSSSSIDENKVLESLIEVLSQQFKNDEEIKENDVEILIDDKNVENKPEIAEENVDGAAVLAVDLPEPEVPEVIENEMPLKINTYARAILEKHLKEAAALGMAYPSVEEFKNALEATIRKSATKPEPVPAKEGTEAPGEVEGAEPATAEPKPKAKSKIKPMPEAVALESEGFDLKGVSLAELHVTVRSTPLIEKVIIATWNFVDIGCVALFLQTWNLLDTAKWAVVMGQYRGFQWVNNYKLDSLVSGASAFAYAMKLTEAIRQLHDETLTPEEKRNACWEAVNSLAEAVFNGAYFVKSSGYMEINSTYISVLAIVAKSIGILNIVTQSPHVYFQVAPAA